MTIRIVVQQSQFLPWAGFWGKVIAADVYVFYAGVRFNAHENENRVSFDDKSWFTLPVTGGRTQLHKDVKLIASKFDLARLLKTLQQRFSPRKYKYASRLEGVLSYFANMKGDEYLLDVNIALQCELMQVLGLNRELHVDTEDRNHLEKIEKLQECLTKYVAGRPYLYYAGAAGLNYMGYDSLPLAEGTRYQRMSSKVSPHSVLQLIAQEEDPLSIIESMSAWEDKDGVMYQYIKGKEYVVQDFA